MNLPGAPVAYARDNWQGILNEIKRVDVQENAKRDRANRFVGAQTIAATLDAQQVVTLTGILTPAQITSNQNDYNPAGLSTTLTLRLSSDASRNITGLQGGTSGRIVVIENVGSFNIVLTNADAASSAANRFSFGGNVTLAPNQCCVLRYDAASSRWRNWASPSSGSGDVTGPGSATDTAVALFNGTTGKAIKNSTVTVDANSLFSTINGSSHIDVDPLNGKVRVFLSGILDGNFTAVSNIGVSIPGFQFNCGASFSGFLCADHSLLAVATGSSPSDLGAGTLNLWAAGGSAPYISFTEKAVGNRGVIGFAGGSASFIVKLGTETIGGGTQIIDFNTTTCGFKVPAKLPSSTVAGLAAAGTAGAGSMAYVTDANATTRLSVAAGGGANKLIVFSDGSNWLIL